jgi:hypothetical protein
MGQSTLGSVANVVCVKTTAGFIERWEPKPATVHQGLRVPRRLLNVAVRKKLSPSTI